MIVYFRDINHKEHRIGIAINQKGCFEIIRKYLDKHNVTYRLFRTWKRDDADKTTVDFGSHYECFLIEE